jgi:hypothetical protein
MLRLPMRTQRNTSAVRLRTLRRAERQPVQPDVHEGAGDEPDEDIDEAA